MDNRNVKTSKKSQELTEDQCFEMFTNFIDNYEGIIPYKVYYNLCVFSGRTMYKLYCKTPSLFYEYWNDHNKEVEEQLQEQNECEQDSPTTTNT